MTLQVPATILRALTQHARREYPRECCGILLGRRRGSDGFVDEFVLADNIAVGDRRTNYQIDWKTLFATVRRTRDGPRALIGFYHSHPDGSGSPSEKDAESAWVDFSYLIIPMTEDRSIEITSWRVPAECAAFAPEAIIPT